LESLTPVSFSALGICCRNQFELGLSAVIAMNLAKYFGLFFWVLTGVVDQTSNRLADVRQLVAFRHRLQELDLFLFQWDFLFCLVFHRVLLAFDEKFSGTGNGPQNPVIEHRVQALALNVGQPEGCTLNSSPL